MNWLSRIVLACAAMMVIVAVVTFVSGRAEGGSGPVRPTAAAESPTDSLIRRLQGRLEANRDDPSGLSQLGYAYLQKTRETGDPSLYPKAQGVFQEALDLDPGDQQALIGLSAVALARHDFTGAKAFAERAVSADSPTPDAYGALGDANIELGNYESAVDAFQRMADLRPDLASYVRISYARELHGDVEGAVAAMMLAVQAAGIRGENAAWTHMQLGDLYFNRGDLDTADHEYAASLEAFPGYTQAVAGQAKVAAARGYYEQAENLYELAVQRIPMVHYVAALGDVYAADGKPDQAQRQYSLVGAIDQLYRANGVNTDLEIAVFDANHDQNAADAIAQARRVYDTGPSVPAADALAWALYKAGNAAAAEPYIREAMRLGTQDANLYYHAGMIHKALGDNETAREELARSLTINAHFSVMQAPIAQQALQELGR